MSIDEMVPVPTPSDSIDVLIKSGSSVVFIGGKRGGEDPARCAI